MAGPVPERRQERDVQGSQAAYMVSLSDDSEDRDDQVLASAGRTSVVAGRSRSGSPIGRSRSGSPIEVPSEDPASDRPEVAGGSRGNIGGDSSVSRPGAGGRPRPNTYDSRATSVASRMWTRRSTSFWRIPDLPWRTCSRRKGQTPVGVSPTWRAQCTSSGAMLRRATSCCSRTR